MKQIKIFCSPFVVKLEVYVNLFLSEISEKNVVDIKIVESNGMFTAMVTFLAEDGYRGEVYDMENLDE